MFYFKFFLLCLWLIFCCVVGIIFLIPHWGTGRLNRDFGRAFSWGALKILGIRVHYEGVEFLETSQPCIYLINHQSALDLAIFGSLFPRNTVIIGKQELLWIPFFGIFYWAAETVYTIITINDAKDDELVVHPVVTPNGDGINDIFLVEGIKNYPDNTVTLANRNGVRIYTARGYDNESLRFDGHSNITGDFQPAGTYFYLIDYTDKGKHKHKTGFIVLKY